MRYVALGLVLAACGGGAKTGAPAPSTTVPAETVKADPTEGASPTGPAQNLETEVDAPPPPTGPTIWERIRVTAGPVPGLEAFSVELEDSRTHCGGTRLLTKRDKKQKVAKGDQALADYFAIEYPLGLDFTEGDKAERSMATFNEWLSKYLELGKKANEQYERQLSESPDLSTKVAAAARLAQVSHRLASILVYAEIPADVRSGEYAAEATEAFCGRMAEVAEPLLARATEAITACAEKARSATVAKSVWWQQVCTVEAK